MLSSPPSISVIISTYNRPMSLVRLLDQIEHQVRFDLTMLDVCVVDDGSDIDLSGLFPPYRFKFSYVYRGRDSSGLPRVYENRNIAASRTHGDIVVQMDDDLNIHTRMISEIQNMAQLFDDPLWLWTMRLSSQTDIDRDEGGFERGPHGYWQDGKATWRICDVGGCSSAGMTTTRIAWDKVNGYNIVYDGTMGYADQDLARRIQRAGASLYLAPLFVHIDDSETGSWRESMIKAAGRSNEFLFNRSHCDKERYR